MKTVDFLNAMRNILAKEKKETTPEIQSVSFLDYCKALIEFASKNQEPTIQPKDNLEYLYEARSLMEEQPSLNQENMKIALLMACNPLRKAYETGNFEYVQIAAEIMAFKPVKKLKK